MNNGSKWTGVLVLILLMASLLFAGIAGGQGEPIPDEAAAEQTKAWEAEQPAADRARATPRPSPTPRPTRPATPAPEPTDEPTAEPTTEPEPTPTDEPEPEPTIPPMDGHDPTMWHAPMLWHDHGADPATAHPVLREAMAEWWTQEIGSAWQSSHHENMWPDGMHAGFTNLVENNIGCPQFNFAGEGYNCVDAYLLQVHAAGSVDHGRIDIHSYKAALWVCSPDGETCGYVLTGGWHDYGFQHAPYKHYRCEQDGDPVIPEAYDFQTPYVGLATEKTNKGQNRIFWNSLGPNAILFDEFLAARGYLPNRGLQVAWSEADAWDYAASDSPLCNDKAADIRRCPDGSTDATCADNGTEFQVFTIRFLELPDERPFIGYTDRHGVVLPDGVCTAEGTDCVPLIISAGVPAGGFVLNRQVGPTYAPLQNFNDGTPLRRPPFSLEE